MRKDEFVIVLILILAVLFVLFINYAPKILIGLDKNLCYFLMLCLMFFLLLENLRIVYDNK